ncbi:MAG: MFS transporter [Infirmifilum sp.]
MFKLRAELDRSLAALLLLALFSSVGNGIINVVLQPYLKHLGLNSQEVGILQSISAIATALSLVPSAYLADLYGRKKIAIASLALSLPGFLLIVFTDKFHPLAVGFAFLGTGNALTAVTLNPLLADITPRDKLDTVASAFQILSLAGGSAGMLLTWTPQLLGSSIDSLLHAYRLLMIAGGAVTTSGFALLLLVRDPATTRQGLKLTFSRDSLVLAALQAATAIGAGASVWLINYYFAAKFGVEAGELGTRMLAESLILIPATSAAPIISSKLGTLKSLLLLQLASIPFLASTPLAPNFPAAASLFTLRSILMNASNPLLWALTMRIIPEDERSRYTMLNILASQLGGGAGSAIGGYLMSTNLDLPLYFTTTVYLLVSITLYHYLKPKTT